MLISLPNSHIPGLPDVAFPDGKVYRSRGWGWRKKQRRSVKYDWYFHEVVA
jgi:hypothetical protein